MKLCLDENISPAIAEALQRILINDVCASVHSLGLLKTGDIPLFGELAKRGFDILITRDKGQMRDPDERGALASSGLSWAGIPQPPGRGVRVFTADLAIVSMVATRLPEWDAPWSKVITIRPPNVEVEDA